MKPLTSIDLMKKELDRDIEKLNNYRRMVKLLVNQVKMKKNIIKRFGGTNDEQQTTKTNTDNGNNA